MTMASHSRPTSEPAAIEAASTFSSSSSTRQHATPPSVVAIPRTSAARLALSSPPSSVPLSSYPIPAPPLEEQENAASPSPFSVLYLAYGSNMAASTFQGERGIRPLSKVAVHSPWLRLVFDLPGLPYNEPCMANSAVRKVPKLPPQVPDVPDVPDVPPVDPPKLPPEVPKLPPWSGGGRRRVEDRGKKVRDTAHGDPVWDKGLFGVVYEVDPIQYRQIIASEGGGLSYMEIETPCLALPPSASIPEKPPVPELPKPFLARTLWAPPDKLPAEPDSSSVSFSSSDDDDCDDKHKLPKKPWYDRFIAPRRRPDPEYAQPSLRYLLLLRDGAYENDLPEDYRDWLRQLAFYAPTRVRQRVGGLLVRWVVGPFMWLFVKVGAPAFFDEKGHMPLWMRVVSGMFFAVLWRVYDVLLKRVFGDGERTTIVDDSDGGEDDEGRRGGGGGGRIRKRWLSSRSRVGGVVADDEEKRALLSDAAD